MLGALKRRLFQKLLIADYQKETHINRALRLLKGRIYLEIGVRNGNSFHKIAAPQKIGVDPDGTGFRSLFPGEFFYEQESDMFFETHAASLFKQHKIDIALVDGLHEFKQVLRDVLNIEQYISPGGVIFIHDCNPLTRKNAEVRDGGIWNGDVWKIAFYLKKFRQDLEFFTLDCDFGLGVLTGFNSSQQNTCVNYIDPQIVEECKNVDYSLLEGNRRKMLKLRVPQYSHLFFRQHVRRRCGGISKY